MLEKTRFSLEYTPTLAFVDKGVVRISYIWEKRETSSVLSEQVKSE
jgi:hypothetical protein